MAEAAQEMLREALDACVDGDAERATAVIQRDSNIDAYYTTIFREQLTYMMENPRTIFRATRVQLIAKYIERIADHATNLAEMVVFMVQGKDIRHVGKLERRARETRDSDSGVSGRSRTSPFRGRLTRGKRPRCPRTRSGVSVVANVQRCEDKTS